MRQVFVRAAAAVALLVSSSALASDYVQEWGPSVGTSLPAIKTTDQEGMARDFASLIGKNGVLLMFNRSADW